MCVPASSIAQSLASGVTVLGEGNGFMCVTHGEYARRVSSWAAQVGLFFYCTLNQINSEMMVLLCMIFETIPLIEDID